jgi:hypothetical protein
MFGPLERSCRAEEVRDLDGVRSGDEANAAVRCDARSGVHRERHDKPKHRAEQRWCERERDHEEYGPSDH